MRSMPEKKNMWALCDIEAKGGKNLILMTFRKGHHNHIYHKRDYHLTSTWEWLVSNKCTIKIVKSEKAEQKIISEETHYQ